MKESKIITIVLSIIFAISTPFLIYSYFYNEVLFNIFLSINSGVAVSIITSLCQYFVLKNKIKYNIYNSYFAIYKAIFISKNHRIINHYEVLNIYKTLVKSAEEISKNLFEYSGFISKEKSKFYKKLDPPFEFNNKVFNIKNIIKLIKPYNTKLYNKIVIPYEKSIENLLTNIDRKRFEKELNEYQKISKKLGIIE